MKTILQITLAFFIVHQSIAQTYTQGAGTTSFNACSGTFYDSGGSGGNYGNNENNITTICGTAGQCVRIDITALDLRNNDVLTLHNGPSNLSPQIGGWTGTSGAQGVFTATSGCLTFWFTSNAAQNRAGWAAAISCVPCPVGADYTMPTVGIQGEYVGSCLVSNCGPSTFADNGDTYANYSDNINNIYRTFCPSVAGNCMQVTFNEFNLFNNFDYLQVKNGPTQNSPEFTTPPSSATAYAGITGLHSDLSGSVPFSYISTDASGCLTFRNYTSGVSNAAGWNAVLSCVPCAGGPNGTDNNDCVTQTPLCSGAAVPGNSSGPGIVAEGCTGSTCPAGGENHSSWYNITIASSGTFNATITPDVATDDYDFAIYGPNVTCNALGAPIRCTDSGLTGTTGLTSSAGDNIESVTGDKFLQTMNVSATQTYIIVVDEWSPGAGGGYSLTFGGTATLDCTVLPIQLSEFTADFIPNENVVDLFWRTESERDNDHFDIERSIDGVNFEVINTLKGAGTTTYETQYITIDESPITGMNYYRLNQFDTDGNSKYSEVRTVNVLDDQYDMLSLFPNPTSGLTELIFNSYTKEQVILNVIGFDGRVIINTPLDVKPGGNRVDLDLSDYPKGVYFVTIQSRDKVYKTKLIKN